MRKNKIIATILLIITIITNIVPLLPQNLSLAVDDNKTGTIRFIECVGEVPYHLKSHDVASGGYVITALAGYDKNGTFYPAYCMNRKAHGADDYETRYNVTLTDVLNNSETYNKVWRVITAGHPYNFEKLGISDWRYAYQATKMAVYCVLGQARVEEFYADDEIGRSIINLIKKLVEEGEHGTRTYQKSVAQINTIGGLQDEGAYYTQNYNIQTNVEIKNFNVSISNFPQGTLLTTAHGFEQSQFNPGDTFQVKIPASQMNNGNINGTVSVTVEAKENAVFYATCNGGVTSDGKPLQDYAVTGDPIVLANTATKLTTQTNNGKVKINKTDAETKNPIKGVEFALYKDGREVAKATTNQDGEAIFTNLYPGKYTLKETATAENYVITNATFDVNVEYNKQTQIDVTNEHKKGNLKIYKVDKDNHQIKLKGVKFELYSEEFQKIVGTYTTNENGEIYIENLRTGKYKLHEIETNKWYNLGEDTNVVIQWDKVTDTVVENERQKSKIKVIKIDKENNEIRIPGVTFEIFDEKNQLVDRIVTDKNGEAISKELPKGKTYTVKETASNELYELSEEVQTVVLGEEEISTLIFENEHKKGNLKIYKVDKNNNKVGISGVEFELYSEEFKKVVGTYTTNENGEIYIENLRTGKYKLHETKTNKWYNLAEKDTNIVVAWNNTTNSTIENELKKGQIRVIKVDKDNNEIRLQGVEFDIYDENGNFIKKLVTDKNGEAVSSKLRIDTKYVLKEIQTLQEYVLTDETQIVMLKQDEIKDVVFENEKKKGKIEITKVSADDNSITGKKAGTVLSNAVFEIYTENDELVDTLITTEDGKATSKLLEYGKYYIKEKSTGSEYYLLNTNKYDVVINGIEDIIPITISNKSVSPQPIRELPKTGF